MNQQHLANRATPLDHEQVHIQRGPRSGLPVIVAVHSTTLGQAIGGCRLTTYSRWTDALSDALRLSAAMTDKCAVAGLPNGGGKTVVAIPPGHTLDPAARRAVLLDVADTIAVLDGIYATGPDVGTGPQDMAVIDERTQYVFCRPPEAGGSGDSSTHTATGVVAALHAVCESVFGSPQLAGRRFAILGLGRVGARLARHLAATRAELVVTDIDTSKRSVADELGATWLPPDEALASDVDVLVPAALGGVFTPDTVTRLRCAAIAGPANNQLDAPATAALLHRRGIVWAPDVVVSAGGIIHATAVELHHETSQQAAARVLRIGDTLARVLRDAARAGVTPAAAATNLARQRLQPSTDTTSREDCR
ncbi:Glu/Leu/Phe/Val dehydrogenase family protein [Micromonospora deserti]|uniref:Glu/Leu/Phe/Val dehydrogenase family protein n=1 Tax=Micromonospora deserti TaxID=2070366 RepID=UPI001F25A5C9|nr:Glu/Leu/Phe/Val dehydrogenase dimerization domain-containing protein [Micromonospora deserti]